MVVCLRCLLHHILSLIAYTFLDNWGFVFIIIAHFMMSVNNRMRFVLQMVFICLYITPSRYHHCANLSEDVELLNACHIHFVECVSKINRILSDPSYNIWGLYYQFSHIPCDDWKNIYIYIYMLCLIIIIRYKVWTLIHFLGLGNQTMVCAVCLFIFLLIF